MRIPNNIHMSQLAIASLGSRETEASEEAVATPLSSDLFYGDHTLHRVATGRLSVRPDRQQRGRYVLRVNAALKIVLPQLEGITPSEINSVMSWAITDIYNDTSETWTRRFQELKGLGIDGVVDWKTIRWLDLELNKIRYYSVDPGREKVIHNSSKANVVGRFYRISERTLATVLADQAALDRLAQNKVPTSVSDSVELANHLTVSIADLDLHFDGSEWQLEIEDSGQELALQFAKYTRENHDVYIHVYAASTYLLDEPSANAARLDRVLAGDRVCVLQEFADWLFVRLDDGCKGYLRRWNVWMESPMPEPTAELYRVRDDDSLYTICQRKYGVEPGNGTDPVIEGLDARFYAAALLFIHNPTGANTKHVTIYAEKRDPLWDLDIIWILMHTYSPVLATLEHNLDYLIERLRQNPIIGPGYTLPAFIEYHVKKNHHLWLPSRESLAALRKWIGSRQLVAQGTALQTIIDYLRESNEQNFLTMFKALWPVGLGVRVDAMVGATFGIPLGVDTSVNCYMYHEMVTQNGDEKHQIRVVRRGKLSGGLDTGVGAGAFFGLGKNPKNKKKGIGALLGVNMRLFMGVQIHQEMVFPVDSVPPIIALAKILDNTGVAASWLIAEMLPMMFEFFNVDPNDYTTKIELSFMSTGIAAGEGSIGLRYGDENHGGVWTNDITTDFSKGDGYILFFLADLLSVTTGLSGEYEIASVLEFEFSDFIVDQESLNYYPTKSSVTAKYEGELALQAKVPVLSALGLALGGGVGLKFDWTYDANQLQPGQELNRQFEAAHLLLYSKNGDMDIWEGPAQEAMFEFNLRLTPTLTWLNPQNFLQDVGEAIPTNMTDLVDSFEIAKIQSRLGASGAFASPWNVEAFNRFARRMNSLPILIKHNRKATNAPILGAYLEIEWNSPADAVVQLIMNDIVYNEGHQVREVFSYLGDYIEVGRLPEKRPDLLLSLFKELDNQAITVHVELGYGLNAGFKAAAVGKVRGRVMVSGAIFWRRRYSIANATSIVQNALKDLYKILGIQGERPDLTLLGLDKVVTQTRKRLAK
ncbi:MAG: hypothetical protein K8S27_03780 [Candidatus Omnitrophica bacterium]|nr:hypothetical protein [Candidatus Omnitrophota bacterium]